MIDKHHQFFNDDSLSASKLILIEIRTKLQIKQMFKQLYSKFTTYNSKINLNSPKLKLKSKLKTCSFLFLNRCICLVLLLS